MRASAVDWQVSANPAMHDVPCGVGDSAGSCRSSLARSEDTPRLWLSWPGTPCLLCDEMLDRTTPPGPGRSDGSTSMPESEPGWFASGSVPSSEAGLFLDCRWLASDVPSELGDCDCEVLDSPCGDGILRLASRMLQSDDDDSGLSLSVAFWTTGRERSEPSLKKPCGCELSIGDTSGDCPQLTGTFDSCPESVVGPDGCGRVCCTGISLPPIALAH